jgi:hypothetical protein
MPDTMLEALRTLIRLELAVGELYKACARRWPEEEAMWLEVAHQESAHARTIERMMSLISRNPAQFVPAKTIRTAAINTIIAGIESTMDQVRSGRLVKRNAHAIAVDIENSVMERKLYEMITTTDHEFLQLCQEIMDQTKAHKERFENRIAELKT